MYYEYVISNSNCLSGSLSSKRDVSYCYIEQFGSFLCIGAYRTSKNAPHLPPAFCPVVDSSDSNADLQAEGSVSASLDLQQMTANTESTQRCSQWRTPNTG